MSKEAVLLMSVPDSSARISPKEMKEMKICLVVVLLLTAVMWQPVWADAGGIPHDPSKAEHSVVVGLTNEDGKTGTFDTTTVGTWTQALGEDGQLHFVYDYQNAAGFDILATDGSGYIVGTIYSLNFDAKPDPQVILNFSCKAGASATTFSFLSAVGVVPWIDSASARASASLTLTDNSYPANGAYATGLFGSDTYQARYNNGSIFTSLVGSFNTPSGSLTASENDPLDGVSFSAIPGTITQMEAEYKFVLKQYDSASGTSNYIIIGTQVPEPSGLLAMASAVVGLVGFTIRTRRKSRP